MTLEQRVQALVNAKVQRHTNNYFALGDLWNWIDSRADIGDPEDYFPATGLGHARELTYASVASKFDKQTRQRYPLLSFGHFEEVRSLDTRAACDLLDRAISEQWTRDELRQARQRVQGVEPVQTLRDSCKSENIADALSRLGIPAGLDVEITRRGDVIRLKIVREKVAAQSDNSFHRDMQKWAIELRKGKS